MEHYYKNVEGWAAFEEIYYIAVQKAATRTPSLFVEVGSWLGRSAALMGVEIINSDKPISFVCVDPWEDGGPDLKDTKYFKDLKKPVYQTFLDNTKPVRDALGKRFDTMAMPSVEAASQFADGSIDFIMLDGDHSYEAVQADIKAWLPKMKSGAIMSGDDYLWPGVKKAADQAFGEHVRPVIKKSPADYRKSVAFWWTLAP